MNILVCLKQILDPEIPARDFRLDPEKKEAARGSANLVTNIFCENALETALQARDRLGGKITALAFGAESAEESLRKALALKVDEVALVLNDGLPHPDPLTVARVLAAAIRKLGSFDLIMLGRESGDWGVGQTGGLLAEELGLPAVCFVDRIEEADAQRVRVQRQTEAGWDSVEVAGPFVATITNDDRNVPRIPKTRDVMMSYRKPLTKWTLDDLGLADARKSSGYYEIVELFIPKKETSCEFIAGDALEEKVDALARRIAEVAQAIG